MGLLSVSLEKIAKGGRLCQSGASGLPNEILVCLGSCRHRMLSQTTRVVSNSGSSAGAIAKPAASAALAKDPTPVTSALDLRSIENSPRFEAKGSDAPHSP
jgi:hypothetical protein